MQMKIHKQYLLGLFYRICHGQKDAIYKDSCHYNVIEIRMS